MRAKWSDILLAFEFGSSDGGMGQNQAYMCKQSGKIYWHSDLADEVEEVPEDIEDEEKYLPIPDKRELGLGKPLVLDFARHCLPNDFDEVRRIFSKRGAYAKFNGQLARRRAVDQWHDFEAKATERALRTWCEVNSIEIDD